MNTGGAFVAGSIVGKLLLDKTGWNASIKSLVKDEAKITGSMGNIGKSIKTVGIYAAAAVSAFAGAVLVMAKQTAKAGEEIYDMSLRTGVSAEMLSGLKLAADKSGTSLEGLALGFRFLGRNMVGAENDVKNSTYAFADLGIKVTDTEGNFRPMVDVMLEVSDRFQSIETEAEMTALAIKLFGRSGTELIPMLRLGSVGLKEQMVLAEKLGVVFTEKTAKAADKYMDSLVDLRGALTGMRNDISNAVIPVLTQLSEGVTKALTYLRGEIKEFTDSGQLAEWAVGTARVFIGAFKLMAQSVEGLVLFVQTNKAMFQDLWGWMRGAAADIADWLADNEEKGSAKLKRAADLGILASLRKFAEAGRDAEKLMKGLADTTLDAAADTVAGFDVWIAALDKLAAGIGKVGEAGKKSFTAITDASKVTAEDMKKNLEELTTEVDKWVTVTKIDEIPIEFDFTNLDMAVPEGIIKDFVDEATKASADASKSIQDMLKNLGPEGLVPAKNEIAAITMTLEKFGDKLPVAKVRELKDRLAELQRQVADPTPWTRFLSDARTAFDSLAAGINPVISQIATNSQIAVENEYKRRLAYINATVKDEEKKQKAITALEAEFQIKRTKQQASAAKMQKAIALAGATMNMAEAITAALTMKPWTPFNFILAAMTAALAAVQVGLIAAQPIPLAEGATFPEPTLLQNVLVGEKRPEYLLDRPKLIDIVREALTVPRFNAAPALAGAGGATVMVNINSPLVVATGYSRRDMDAAGEYLMQVIDRQLVRVGAKPLIPR